MLIGMRNAMMTGKRLPYDAEVEYIESTGTQWIDTLVNADSNLSVEVTMANVGTPWNNVNPMGAILMTPLRRHHLNFNNKTNRYGVCYYIGNGEYFVNSKYMPADGEIFTFKVDAISKTFTLGSFIGTFQDDTFDTGMSYWLFGRNGTTPPYLGSLRIYSATLWNGNTLVRDFIPVRKGTVGYLYDRVSKRLFGNAGTGDFVLGPDVVPVEYIAPQILTYAEQYTTRINTDISPTANTEVSAEMYPLNNNAGDQTIGSRAGNGALNRFFVYSMNENGRFVLGNNSLVNQYLTGQRFVVVFNETNTHKVLVNGLEKETFDPSKFANQNQAKKIILFATSGYEPAYGTSNTRIYWCKIRNNGTLVRSFRPVRIGTDATSWEGAMMDVLTRRIYRNAGTGAFTYGNDLKYPIPSE